MLASVAHMHIARAVWAMLEADPGPGMQATGVGVGLLAACVGHADTCCLLRPGMVRAGPEHRPHVPRHALELCAMYRRLLEASGDEQGAGMEISNRTLHQVNSRRFAVRQ